VPSADAQALLRRLLPKLRAAFPAARLCVRLDAGFVGGRLLTFLEAEGVDYAVSLQGTAKLARRVRRLLGRAAVQARMTGQSVQLVGETRYEAQRWRRARRVIMKAEVLRYPGRPAKRNPRFVVTNLSAPPAAVYAWYCGRGDMKNRLKELQDGLALDRTSCSRFGANHFRVLLTAAVVLYQALQAELPTEAGGTLQVPTLRDRFIKLAAWIERSVRRVVLHLPVTFPWARPWRRLAVAVGATP
jgi:hypothetical protein